MRELYPNLNAMAPAPKGETIYKGPARFEAGAPLSRFEGALAEGNGKVDLSLHYGDRTLTLTFTR
jgi:hypothetical protein